MPGGGNERADRSRELLRASVDDLERRSVLVRLAPTSKCQLALGDQAGEGRTQFVRHLGREPLLAPQAGGEPVEQTVQGSRKLGQLVVRLAEPEPLVEIALAPGGRLPCHTRHRPEPRARRGAGRGRRERASRRAPSCAFARRGRARCLPRRCPGAGRRRRRAPRRAARRRSRPPRTVPVRPRGDRLRPRRARRRAEPPGRGRARRPRRCCRVRRRRAPRPGRGGLAPAE